MYEIESALQVGAQDGVPGLLGTLDNRTAPDDGSVGDQDVQGPESLRRPLHRATRRNMIGDVRVVRDGFSPKRLDLAHHRVGMNRIPSPAAKCAAEIVDDDPRTLTRQHQRVLAANPPAGSSNDRNLSCEPVHGFEPSAVAGIDAGRGVFRADGRSSASTVQRRTTRRRGK